jgi:hypothetical protein
VWLLAARCVFRPRTRLPFGVDFEAEHQAQVKLIDVRANRLSSREKAGHVTGYLESDDDE